MFVLANKDLYRFYTSLPVVQQHQQRPVVIPDDARRQWQGILDLDSYIPEQGFVGFGVNLIHMTDAQLQVLIPLEAQAGKQHGS